MPRAYTVDRAGTLREGMTLRLKRHADLQPPPLQADVDRLFPNGVSQHGEVYFLRGSSTALALNPNIELMFEMTRRALAPAAPSRFTSWFGCETEADARTFASSPTWGKPGAAIYEVETDTTPFRADMSCLTIQGSILVATHAAMRYWSGDANDQHIYPGAPPLPVFWELLLSPPVSVLRKL